jgi:drug/metabolite transporter (DMT)-like permease
VAAGWRGNLVLPDRKAMLNFTLLGFLGITFHQLLQSHALLTSRASTTAWIIAATPVFIALLGYLVLKEKISMIHLAGIVIATIGVILVISNGDFRALFSGGVGSPGDILIIISALNWAVFTVLSRPWLQRYSPAQMMFYVMLCGWLFLTILYIASPTPVKINQLSTQTWLAIAFLGIICSGFAYIFWYDALQAIQASQVGVFLNIEPLVATFAAALILDEPITVISITGGLVILFGVWLVNQPQAINLPAFLKSARR